ncbi:hypothetical protein P3T18_004757 [Paraburkholderia sp. GAS199]
MDTTVFDIPAVVIVLGVIGFTVVRAFLSSRADDIDVFMKRSLPDDHHAH